MTYLPLARKWRPQSFADVVGQEPVTTTLTNAIVLKRVAHAYLFAGPRGVGKTSTARILAKSLNCVKGPTPAPCQECPSCLAITRGSSLDVLEIDGASNRGIDQIRELRENVKFLPSQGQFKVYIIDEVHQITPDGFNALLKTLEEPPPHVTFIFATTHPEKVLPTILSRCQRFDFRRVPVRELVAISQRIAAQEHIAADEAALYAIATAADGSVRDAESMLDQLWNFSDGTITLALVNDLLGLVERELVLQIIAQVLARDASAPLRVVDQLLQRGKDVTQVSAALVETLRHLLVAKSLVPGGAPADAATLPWDELGRLIELPREDLQQLVALSGTTTATDVLYILQLLARAHETVKRSQHGRVHLELALVKVATRADFTSLQSLLEQWPQETSTVPIVPMPPPATSPVALAASPSPAPPAATPSASAPSVTPSPHVPHQAMTLATVESAWDRILADVGRQRMSVASCLAKGKPLELIGDRLIVGVPDVVLHRELLEAAENRKLIERILASALATPRVAVSFRAIALAEVPPVAPPRPEPHVADIVQSALKMFNAKVIDGRS